MLLIPKKDISLEDNEDDNNDQDEYGGYFSSKILSRSSRHGRARTGFRDLRMNASDKFTAFRIEFVKQAGMARVSPADYKRELFDKLPSRLNERCVDQSHDDTMNFAKFCDYVQRHDHLQNKNFLSR
ncbi:hypothetical protein F4819DRAFT_473701 [Hypoxylon fuscum]|nr:hypothetical protein F4819DRAFT_473701 [Hypoxylon fuscum]